MNIQDFLISAESASWWADNQCLQFTGPEYFANFFAMIFNYSKKKNLLPASFQKINCDAIEKRELHGMLHQSILGASSFFWLGNIEEGKKTKGLSEQLSIYHGPHHIAFFKKNDTAIDDKAIFIPLKIDKNIFDQIILFFSINFDKQKQFFIQNLFPYNDGINLETCCMLIQYLELINSKYLDQYIPFFNSIIGQTPQLILLTELFFSRQSSRFFDTWSNQSKNYPEIFWIIFWSEQIWRAYHVITFLKKKEFSNAKRMSFRLPYSFINRDWQSCNTKTLALALKFLYHMDYALKKGSTFCSIDLFYINYFTGSIEESIKHVSL